MEVLSSGDLNTAYNIYLHTEFYTSVLIYINQYKSW